MKPDFDFSPYYGKMCEVEYILKGSKPIRNQGVVKQLKYYLDHPDKIIFRGYYLRKDRVVSIKVIA